MENIAFQLSELISLLLIACAVGVLVKYIRLPYTIALVLVGLLVGALKLLPEIPLTEEIIFFLILPPLLFEGALNMDVQHLRANLRPITLLAIPGVLISTIFVGLALNYLLDIPLPVALLFGAMITPTDPVSVLATFRALGAPKRLTTILEGESILNDGVAVVLFSIILEMVRSGELDILHGALNFVFVCIGGFAVGLILGYAAYKALGYIDDHQIEVAITLILAFSSFVIAEMLHVSGVIAVVAAGLVIGNYGRYFSMSPSTRVALTTFWGFFVFLVNSFVFILIGLDIHLEKIALYWEPIVLAIAVVLASRALSVYPLLNIFSFKFEKVPLLWQHVIFWGGLHGTIPVALALGLESEIPYRELIASMTFGVVLFSLVVQGLSLEFFVRRSSLARKDDVRLKYEELLARSIALKAAKKELENMLEEGVIAPEIADKMLSDINTLLEDLTVEFDSLVKEYDEVGREMWMVAWRKVLHAQKSAIQDAVVKGLISEEVAGKLAEEIDAELSELMEA